MRQKHPVFAVLRVDEFLGPDTPLENRVTVKEVVRTLEIAESEVKRLTRLNSGKRCRYFWQATRLMELSELAE